MKIKKIKSNSKKTIKTIGYETGILNGKYKSRHECKIYTFYFRMLFYFFISVFSLGILMPYAYYKYSYFKYENSYIDNERLIFTGKLEDVYMSFIGGYILYSISLIGLNFLSMNIIPLLHIDNDLINKLITTAFNVLPTALFTTFIIYRFYKWQQQNLHFVRYKDEPSFYEVHILMALLKVIINKLINLFTLGFGRPATTKFRYFFLINRQYVSGKKLSFNGLVLSAYSWLLLRYILIFPTFGLYLPIYIYKLNMWIIIHTHISKKQDNKNHKIHII